MDNKQVYQTKEFEAWASGSELIRAEEFLISQYLKKNVPTCEAGTGGGRILISMKNAGFSDLYGFDFVPELIERAKQRDRTEEIRFSVQDALELTYADESFSQIIYLQQILSFLGRKESISMALGESFRILKKGGVALFSFCNLDARLEQPGYRALIQYLILLRKIKASATSMQMMPWFKLGGKPNIGLLLDRPPYNYWFRPREAYNLLVGSGYTVTGMASQHQIDHGELMADIDTFCQAPQTGMLYFVCRK